MIQKRSYVYPYRTPYIVTDIKVARMRRVDHVQRVNNNKKSKKIMENIPMGKQEAGRPRPRWMDGW